MKYLGFILAALLGVLAFAFNESAKKAVAQQRQRSHSSLTDTREQLNKAFENQEGRLQELEERLARERRETAQLRQKYSSLSERRKQLKSRIAELRGQIAENRRLIANFSANRASYLRSIERAQELMAAVEKDIRLLQTQLKTVSTGWE